MRSYVYVRLHVNSINPILNSIKILYRNNTFLLFLMFFILTLTKKINEKVRKKLR